MNAQAETILNVDDDEAALYATSRSLRRAGFTVLEAKTGEAALSIIREHRPPLVVLDVNLPDMSGIEVCRIIKQDPATRSVMVLQMSATSIGVANRVEALSAGADSFLVEPVEHEELEAVARALLRLQRTEAALRTSLEERNLLLKEINHRVKNSLQLVTSMLHLQSQEFTDAEARERFQHAVSRVMAIASVHERLYRDDDPLTVAMDEYLTNLCRGLTEAGIADHHATSIEVKIEPLRLPTEAAVPVALIINELVTNSLKYARAREHTVIKVLLHRLDSPEILLRVEDNGQGVMSGTSKRGGLGRRLVNTFVRQLKGRVETKNTAEGYEVSVVFPERHS